MPTWLPTALGKRKNSLTDGDLSGDDLADADVLTKPERNKEASDCAEQPQICSRGSVLYLVQTR
jgi:hypothetical protein